jgi:hypothetical protein
VSAFGFAEQQVEFVSFVGVDGLDGLGEGSGVEAEVLERLFESLD